MTGDHNSSNVGSKFSLILQLLLPIILCLIVIDCTPMKRNEFKDNFNSNTLLQLTMTYLKFDEIYFSF